MPSPPPETIRLDQFLKIQGIAQTGGHAKLMIQSGEIVVNGEIETRRRKQLQLGDEIEFDGQLWRVESDGEG
ncbi:MAG: hypothetical protein CMJ48_03800 [Planctomycetaceae bacterium]|nr:hypothetical protein [Planctomycetaceae bacterium]